MLRVAIVEDNDRDADYLLSHLKRYARENNVEIESTRYESAILFLDQYQGDFDLIFMDIDMPAMNGMTYEHRGTESSLYVDENGHDSCVNLYMDSDNNVFEIDWSTYTG